MAQDGGRDSKPGVGPRDLTPPAPIRGGIIDMQRLDRDTYRMLMTELLTEQGE